ncbi:hypothetical protein J2I47_01125 [Fibrella sp. HMF5335]|uniref:Uncharacterized protein n=1 Tax=Fibrella rubiginis TaxID=2817060 RepID=A0A939JZJ9_9BACT|nr:hypothetical protein [Fibrella rubiginis]MBO0935137.1 hypothetical protein [Fibrella rubiginis]
MVLSHMLSDAVLAATGLGVYATSFQRLPFFNRILWGFFFLTISLAALVGVFTFGGLVALEPLHQSLTKLAGSLGVVCLVVAVYAQTRLKPATPLIFGSTLVVGVVVFVLLFLPTIRVFAPVVPALGILLVMLLAVFALLRQQRWAVWIVVAVMLMALATKVDKVALPIHPTDAYHYLLALGLLSFGKAARTARLAH